MVTPKTPETQRAPDRAKMAALAGELAALESMPTRKLAQRFYELFGYPTKSQNRPHLRKRIAWRLQEEAQGGLSMRALERIEQLAPLAPARWSRPRESASAPGSSPTIAGSTATAPATTTAPTPASPTPESPAPAPLVTSVPLAPSRDPRLPAPGSVLSRAHGGVEHRVTVLEDGFEYKSERFRSLSKIARAITGTGWNGFLFFGLSSRAREEVRDEAGGAS